MPYCIKILCEFCNRQLGLSATLQTFLHNTFFYCDEKCKIKRENPNIVDCDECEGTGTSGWEYNRERCEKCNHTGLIEKEKWICPWCDRNHCICDEVNLCPFCNKTTEQCPPNGIGPACQPMEKW